MITNLVITTLDWVGRVTAVLFLLTLVLGIYAWAKGILPALVRLGNGFSKRKIAIFAKGDNVNTLMHLLLDTKLFDKKNIIDISSDADFGRAERATLFLIFWDDWQDKIDEILGAKKDTTALVVYAPKGPASIPPAKFVELNSKRNVMVTNFRGRLLNDIIISLMTTSYQ
jgi:hypothetical protein